MKALSQEEKERKKEIIYLIASLNSLLKDRHFLISNNKGDRWTPLFEAAKSQREKEIEKLLCIDLDRIIRVYK